MKYIIKFSSLIALASISLLAYSDSITDSYATGDTLTADTLNNIKSAVNDNDSNIISNTTNITTNDSNIGANATSIGDNFSDITDHETRITTLEGSAATQQQLSGVEFDDSSSTIAVTSTESTVMSTEVTAPSDGYVIVSFSSAVYLTHVNGTRDTTRLWLSTDPSSEATFDETWRFFQVLAADTISGIRWSSLHSQAVFQVTAGVSTFYARADAGASGANYRNTSMNAIFVPNHY